MTYLSSNAGNWRIDTRPNIDRSENTIGRPPSPQGLRFKRWAKRQQQHESTGPQQIMDLTGHHHGPFMPKQQKAETGAGALDAAYGSFGNTTVVQSGPRMASKSGNDKKSSSGATLWVKATRPRTLTRSSDVQKRQTLAAVPPPLTREEFEALPLAIQRKFFSTLERLRFAQDSGAAEGISQHYDAILKRQQGARDQREHHRANTRPWQSVDLHTPSQPSLLSKDTGSDKKDAQNPQYTRQEQLALARQLRASVILDAADEAIYKINRRMSARPLIPEFGLLSPSPPSSLVSSRRVSMASLGVAQPQAAKVDAKQATDSFYDSFRWLDDEDDLDLRLKLNQLSLPSRPQERPEWPLDSRRLSFPRRISLTKPFGRVSSSHSSRPPTNDGPTPNFPSPPTGPSMKSDKASHNRRKSRALSLIAPRYEPQEEAVTFDPDATYYQDPEARLKLRVYLASPQKFDEAIEFGFPSKDVLGPAPCGTRDPNSRAHHRQSSSDQAMVDEPPYLGSFLADLEDDEDDGLNTEDGGRFSPASDPASASSDDPDSPRTPDEFDTRPVQPGPWKELPRSRIQVDCAYAQAPAGSREMTLRMTLTRPDLRASQDAAYGWYHARAPLRTGVGELSSNVRALGGDQGDALQSGDQVFFGSSWPGAPADRGVMKRLWKRVRGA